MREILFRGKEIESGEWIFGSLLSGYLENGRTQILNHDNGDWEDVIPETIGQFTGLTDKNGEKIFEGDICKVDGLIYKVAFNFSGWCYQIISNKVYCYPYFHSHVGEHCEVIGNIYDTPELLGISHEHH